MSMFLVVKKWLRINIIPIIYLQVWLGVLGSLFFSLVLKLPPCSLCVYQRMLLYPLALIIGVAWWRRDKDNLIWYTLPFSLGGLLVSAYHNFLYWKIIPVDTFTCSPQLPCVAEDFALWGFVTIPLLSFFAFAFISVGLAFFYWSKNKAQ